jgi:hypothetical protein
MKIEWCYKGQDTYKSYANRDNLLQSLDFLKSLVNDQTDYEYKDIVAVRVELNQFLWISIAKNWLGKEDYYIMCGDYDIGKLNSFKDVEIFMREL